MASAPHRALAGLCRLSVDLDYLAQVVHDCLWAVLGRHLLAAALLRPIHHLSAVFESRLLDQVAHLLSSPASPSVG